MKTIALILAGISFFYAVTNILNEERRLEVIVALLFHITFYNLYLVI